MAKRRMLDEVLAQAGREENLSEEGRAELEAERERAKAWERVAAKGTPDDGEGETVTEPPAETEPEQETIQETIQESEQEPAEESIVEPPAETIARGLDTLPLSDAEKDAILTARLREILGRPKLKGALPTLVRYHQDGLAPLRAVIVDIGDADLREGWELYKANVPKADPEMYLLKVYELTRSEIPRLYRTVGELMLE